jgi:hypothetical protein
MALLMLTTVCEPAARTTVAGHVTGPAKVTGAFDGDRVAGG